MMGDIAVLGLVLVVGAAVVLAAVLVAYISSSTAD